MKYVYIVKYWVPFPSSEYGGMSVVVAENDEECVALLLAGEAAWHSQHNDKISAAVTKAKKYALQSNPISEVVMEFHT